LFKPCVSFLVRLVLGSTLSFGNIFHFSFLKKNKSIISFNVLFYFIYADYENYFILTVSQVLIAYLGAKLKSIFVS